MDCREAVRAALLRMGIVIRPDAFDGHDDRWHRVDAPQPGDVIVSRPAGALHVSAVIDARPGRGVALSASRVGGVYTTALARAMTDCDGVYRYR
jgi:hypothetical protein